jgi:pyruvate,water dikinase
MRKHTSRLERVDRAVLPDRELLGLLDFLMSGRHFRGDTLVAGIVGSMCFQRLFTICRDWLGDNDGSLANALLACVGGVNSAESGLDLWRLAIFARSAPNLRNSLLADGNLNATFGKLAGQVGGKEFLARWDAFMAKHGHHARGELDVMIPRWREQPETVLRIVRSYLQDGVPDPLEAYQRRARERCRLEAECRRRLRNPFKRLIFPWVVDQAQRYCRVRENVKSEGVRGLALVRSLFLEIGSRLQNRGMIETTEDIFFLRIEEIEPVFFGKADFDFQAAIAARRHEFEANQTLDPPLLVIGRPDAPLLNPEPVDGTSRMLSGVGVSAGRVQGRARVIVRSDSQEQIMPGEILVAPSTDPGWTPYFLNAAGIVMDLGGLLSHGSIIARECGIPAVVNVGSATRIIRTGQLLHVDGTGGRVHLLD